MLKKPSNSRSLLVNTPRTPSEFFASLVFNEIILESSDSKLLWGEDKRN